MSQTLDARAISLAKSIIKEKLEYTVAITSRPDLKDDIDTYLIREGYAKLITVVDQ